MLFTSILVTLGSQLLLVTETVSNTTDRSTYQPPEIRYTEERVAEAAVACENEFNGIPTIISDPDENNEYDAPLCIETIDKGKSLDESPFIDYAKTYRFIREETIESYANEAQTCHDNGLSYGFEFSAIDITVDNTYCINTKGWDKYSDFDNLPDLTEQG